MTIAALAGFYFGGGVSDLTEPGAAPNTPAIALTYIELPEIIVNLHPEARSRYLKIALTISVPSDRRAEAERLLPQFQHAMQEFLRQLDDNDLRGSAGLFRLRTELRRRFALFAGDDLVTDVLLRSFLTQ